MTFASQLREERKRLGLSQARAATALGVSPRAIWEWERRRPPDCIKQEGALARLRAMQTPKESE